MIGPSWNLGVDPAPERAAAGTIFCLGLRWLETENRHYDMGLVRRTGL